MHVIGKCGQCTQYIIMFHRAGSALVRALSHGIHTRPGFRKYWMDSRRPVKVFTVFNKNPVLSCGRVAHKEFLECDNVIICLGHKPGELLASTTRPCKNLTSSAPQGQHRIENDHVL